MKNKHIKQVRQGDVLVELIDSVPSSAVRVKPDNGRIILAHGEATGHHHSIAADAADWWKDDKTGDQYIQVATPVGLVHQEHSEIQIKPGCYKITRQREYHPSEIRNVAD